MGPIIWVFLVVLSLDSPEPIVLRTPEPFPLLCEEVLAVPKPPNQDSSELEVPVNDEVIYAVPPYEVHLQLKPWRTFELAVFEDDGVHWYHYEHSSQGKLLGDPPNLLGNDYTWRYWGGAYQKETDRFQLKVSFQGDIQKNRVPCSYFTFEFKVKAKPDPRRNRPTSPATRGKSS